MNTTPKDEVISKIVEVIKSPLEENGFSLKRKRLFEREGLNSNIQQYSISLSKRKGYFSLHLSLGIFNKPLLKNVNAVLKKALSDREYPHYEGWDNKSIESNIKVRIGNHYLSGLTDWKRFKEEGETLKEFAGRFSIWFCIFDEIEEIANWESQLLKSVEFALTYFAVETADAEWIINNTSLPALFLLKEAGRLDELTQKYEFLLEHKWHKWHKKELELFYKHLLA
jgi:hypothetical protein